MTLTSTSSILHIYHINKLLLHISSYPHHESRNHTYLYGENLAAISSISCSLIYFHFPPFPFNFVTSFPTYAAIPRCTPRSPVLNTSHRFSPKHANISTLHRPNPLTETSISITSSSVAVTSFWAESSPEANFEASPWMYSALRWERPAVRRVSRGVEATREGAGKEECESEEVGSRESGREGLKREMNLRFMEAAAAPETWS
jgi:hypothetical protein